MKSDKGKEMLTFTDWYYQDSKIMQSILDTQGIEIDAIRDKIKDILEQFYVDTATWGLDLWEKELNIQDTIGDYSERRNRIKLYLAKPVSVTPRFLTDLINGYSEKKSAKIIEHNSEYCFEIEVAADDKIDWDNINKSVKLYKPAHLGFYTSLKIFLLTRIINTVRSINYLNANHNFWNLGAAEKTYWDGVWCWDGSIDWSGIKPDAKYKKRQSHIIDILTKVNSAQTFKTGQSADITYKITSKHRLLTSHKAGSIYYVDIDLKQNIEHRALNTGKINAAQSRTTGNAKNLWDGSFCWDGSHAWEGDYTLQNAQMENLCTVYSTDRNGNIKKGTFERL